MRVSPDVGHNVRRTLLLSLTPSVLAVAWGVLNSIRERKVFT